VRAVEAAFCAFIEAKRESLDRSRGRSRRCKMRDLARVGCDSQTLPPHCPDCEKELLTHCPNNRCLGSVFRARGKAVFIINTGRELAPYQAHR
jgi:hypothetical protein